MGIISKLTKKHLKENKGRTIVTILGITVSVAMITAVFATVASFFDFFGKLAIISDGNGVATFRLISLDTIEQLKKDERVDVVGIISEDEAQSAYTLLNGNNMFTQRGSIYTADLNNLNQMVSCNYEGRLPKSGDEIAVDESILWDNSLNCGIGDSIKMQLGQRTIIDGDGVEKNYHGEYISDENFYPDEIREFTITAILHNNVATDSYKVLRGADASNLAKVPAGKLSAMISLKKTDYHSYRVVVGMMEQYGIEHYILNTELLDSHFSLRKNSSFADLLPLLAVVVICIIVFSVSLIYNAFSMSLSERVKYLGMLSSVGATRIQNRLSVYYEGFLLGIIGIPLGIISGLVGIYITLKLIGSRLITSGVFPAITDTSQIGQLPLIIPVWLLPCIILTSALTIFIASMVPAKRASEIMPIDAIRQTNEIKIKKNELKVPAIVRKLFGYEGVLAYKNLKRNGRKGKVIIISIIISLTMFLCMNHFCNLFWEVNSKTYSVPFDVYATVSYEQRDSLLKEIAKLPDISDYYGIDMFTYYYKRNDAKSPNMKFMDSEHFTNAYKKMFESELTVLLHLVSDEDFRQLCANQQIDPEPYFGDETNALLVNNVSYHDNGPEVFTNAMLGQQMFYDDRSNNNPAIITIKGFAKWEDNPHIIGISSKNTAIAIIPYSNYVKTVYGDNTDELTYSIGIETDKHKEICTRLQHILIAKQYNNIQCVDMDETRGVLSALLYVIKVFTYGFITLITIIAITNIINTVSTGIALRRKEFAVLKSVGMTPAGFSKMLRLEGYLYGIKSTLWGIPLSIVLCLLMNSAIENGIRLIPNFVLFAGAVLVIFTLIRISMIFALKKLKDDPIVEVLKEEIN